MQLETFLELEAAEDEMKQIVEFFNNSMSVFTHKYMKCCPNITGQATQYFLIKYFTLLRGLCHTENDFENIINMAKMLALREHEIAHS